MGRVGCRTKKLCPILFGNEGLYGIVIRREYTGYPAQRWVSSFRVLLKVVFEQHVPRIAEGLLATELLSPRTQYQQEESAQQRDDREGDTGPKQETRRRGVWFFLFLLVGAFCPVLMLFDVCHGIILCLSRLRYPLRPLSR